MRHGNKINHLGRKKAHREAMLANMAISLIEHKRINTTVAKAKALRKYVEPLISKSKMDSTHSRRVVFSYLNNKEAVTELFREVAPKVADRPGGYLRILKTGRRIGDSAEMCMIELVDFNELLLESGKTKTKRSRRGGKKKAEGVSAAPAVEVASKEAPASEEVVEQVAPETAEDAGDSAKELSENTDDKKEE
jgi:large subunit ribosomal protein L17